MFGTGALEPPARLLDGCKGQIYGSAALSISCPGRSVVIPEWSSNKAPAADCACVHRFPISVADAGRPTAPMSPEPRSPVAHHSMRP